MPRQRPSRTSPEAWQISQEQHDAGKTEVPGQPGGLAASSSDGRLALFDAHANGSLRLAWAEAATRLVYGGATRVESPVPGTLAVAPGSERFEFVIDNGQDQVQVLLDGTDR